MHRFGQRVVREGLLDLDGLAGVDEAVDVRGHRIRRYRLGLAPDLVQRAATPASA
jgi:hypothetical protein